MGHPGSPLPNPSRPDIRAGTWAVEAAPCHLPPAGPRRCHAGNAGRPPPRHWPIPTAPGPDVKGRGERQAVVPRDRDERSQPHRNRGDEHVGRCKCSDVEHRTRFLASTVVITRLVQGPTRSSGRAVPRSGPSERDRVGIPSLYFCLNWADRAAFSRSRQYSSSSPMVMPPRSSSSGVVTNEVYRGAVPGHLERPPTWGQLRRLGQPAAIMEGTGRYLKAMLMPDVTRNLSAIEQGVPRGPDQLLLGGPRESVPLGPKS